MVKQSVAPWCSKPKLVEMVVTIVIVTGGEVVLAENEWKNMERLC